MNTVTIRAAELEPYCRGCSHFEPEVYGPDGAPVELCMIDCVHHELCADLADRLRDKARK